MMRRFLFILLLAALAYPQAVDSQESPPLLLAAAGSRDDWGIAALRSVRFGRVARVEASGGTHLELRRLQETAPARPTVSTEGTMPTFNGNTLTVSDFGRGNRTPLGGYFGTFQKAPSSAWASVDLMADGRRAMELTCHHGEGGFCGAWIQLYDFEESPDARSYLDTRAFSTMSFWIRGRAGGESLLLKVADAAWEEREDALPIGDVSAFLSSGRLSTEWQQAVVPMDRFPAGARRDLLALIAFEVLVPGTTTVEVGPMAFSLAPGPLPALPPAASTDRPVDLRHKATWVWNTAELLEEPERQEPLLGFLESEGFDRVFLQLPGTPDRPSLPGELAVDVEAMRPLVSAFNNRGMRVYALDGYARYALPEFHAGVLATVDHVAQYNETVLPHERFYGIRYDIEPYILPEFHGPNRSALLTGLLELTAASVERAQAAGLVYGADIPFWYDAVSEDTFEPVNVLFRGAEKAVSDHIIDLVDDVSIMAYRTTAYGADGTIRHGTGELEYAEKAGKPVFIALETFALPDEVLLDFHGEPGQGMPTTPPPGPLVAVGADRDSIYAVLVPDPTTSAGSLDALAAWIDQNRLDPGQLLWWPVGRRVEVPAAKITFADQNPEMMDRVMRATAEEFKRFDSFAGFAIHFAQSFRSFLGR